MCESTTTGGCSEGLDAFRFFFKQQHFLSLTQSCCHKCKIKRELQTPQALLVCMYRIVILQVNFPLSPLCIIMTRLICTGTLTRSRSLMSPCCKAVKGVSRKHTGNLLFYCLLTEAVRTLSRAGIPSVPKILKRELYGNFLAYAKGYQFSSKICQRL